MPEVFAQSLMFSSIAIYYMHTVKWFQVLLFIVSTQLNGFKYSNQTLKIQFNINHLFAHSLNGFKYSE